MGENVKRTGRELAYQGSILTVYKDYMEFENGNTAVFDFIHHDGAAAVVPVLPDGRLLMVCQYRNALERDTLEIPAGKLDDPRNWKKRPDTAAISWSGCLPSGQPWRSVMKKLRYSWQEI